MANHKSAEKRIRSSKKKRTSNRYQGKTVRNAVKELKATADKEEMQKKMPDVVSQIDKLAKKNVIHKNKAANLKSKLMKGEPKAELAQIITPNSTTVIPAPPRFHVFIVEFFYLLYRSQIIASHLAQHAISLAMQDIDLLQVVHDRIVDEAHHGGEGFIGPETPNVQA